MEVLKWEDKTWLGIPDQDKPVENEECLIIVKQNYDKPPKKNTGEWEVLWWKRDEMNDMCWGLQYVGLFWELEHAEMFAESLSLK